MPALIVGAGTLVAAMCTPGSGSLPMMQVPGGDPQRGKAAIQHYGCGSCHVIPGVPGARGKAAPPLSSFADRISIAGEVPNTPDNLVRWIQDPQSIEAATIMPDLGVTEGDARDIAAYLYTLR